MGIIVVNFKTYKESTGKQAVKLAKICEKVAMKQKVRVIVAVQNVDLFRISGKVSIPVFAEHMDPVGYGANTGKDLPEDLVENGAKGVIVNHSEDSVPLAMIKEDIERAKSIGLTTIACAPTALMTERIAKLNPDYLAIEPPELIGGNISVSKARPELITETINKVRSVNKTVPVLCGAGIKNSEDVRIAMELGCSGILVASGVTKANDPEEALLDLASGMKQTKKNSSATANTRGLVARTKKHTANTHAEPRVALLRINSTNRKKTKR